MKKVFLGIFLILLLFTVYEIGISYSLFETNNNIETETDVGQWKIKVNNSILNTDLDFEITDFIYTNQPGVRNGKMAPGKTGSFSINIDPDVTDVAFKYDIIIDEKAFTNDRFKITSVQDTNGSSLTLTNREKTYDAQNRLTSNKYYYTGLYSLDDITNGNVRNIKIDVMWVNDESNNETDTVWGMSGEKISIPIMVHFEQYLGETISVYAGPIV